MKPMMFAAVFAMLLSGCQVSRSPGSSNAGSPDPDAVSRGLDAAAAELAVRCATLDDVLVRLTIDSVARAIGNTRRIERLRAERRLVCAEAAARKTGASAKFADRDVTRSP